MFKSFFSNFLLEKKYTIFTLMLKWFINNKKSLLPVLEAGEFNINGAAVLVSGRAVPHRGTEGDFSVSLCGERSK